MAQQASIGEGFNQSFTDTPHSLLALQRIYQPIASVLKEVEEELKRRFSGIALFPDGKRLRPAIALFASNRKNRKKAVLLAVAIELIHTASLLHDDILDETLVRRGDLALYVSLGVKRALLYGDYLFTQGLDLIRTLGIKKIRDQAIEAVREMGEGQWFEEMNCERADFCLKDYLRIINKKTGQFFAFSAQSGGILRSATSKELATLFNYGLNFGLAYQILDDAVDLENRNEPLNKWFLKMGGKEFLYKLAEPHLKAAKRLTLSLPNKRMGQSLASLVDWLKPDREEK